MMNNNNDNKDIKFTGDPVAFDGVEGKRDPKTGKGRFDLIPEEVFEPLFDRVHKLETTEPYTVDCTPASILNDIANENMLDAIIKITILKYYNTDSAIDAMCRQIEAGAFLECCWTCFLIWPFISRREPNTTARETVRMASRSGASRIPQCVMQHRRLLERQMNRI